MTSGEKHTIRDNNEGCVLLKYEIKFSTSQNGQKQSSRIRWDYNRNFLCLR